MKTILALSAVSLLLASCAHQPFEPSTAASAVPAAFARAGEAGVQPPDPAWWRALGDPTLDALVQRALTANRDLLAAEQDLARARALAGLERWSLFPVGGVSAEAGRERTTAPTISENDLYALGAAVSWEADVFGRLRAGSRAAEADALAVEEAARGVRVAIAAQTASTYVALRGAQARLASARANARSQADTLKLTEALRTAGRSDRLDVARAREQVQTTESVLAGLEAEIAGAVEALQALTAGLTPELRAALEQPANLPLLPAQLAVGDPDGLLKRRPDIRQAQARVESAAHRYRAAQVDWWPRLTFTGALSSRAFEAGNLGDSSALGFFVGPRIDWPALDFRRNQLRTEAAKAGAEAEFLRYDQAVLGAVRDVETALADLTASGRTAASLAAAVESAREAAELSRLRYREGADPFFSVLDAERRLADAEDRLAIARTRQNLAYIQLGQSLGAGWSGPG